jgi:trehalose 6-phosphate phosphatase
MGGHALVGGEQNGRPPASCRRMRMKTQCNEIIQVLLSAYRHGRKLLLLFDYDGTLTPIVAHPRLATLHPTTRRTLINLSRRPRVEIGIVSGRGIDELKHIVALRQIYYVGTSGLQLELGGMRITHPKADEMILLLARFRKPLRNVIRQFPGAWLEDKQLGLTIHYREVHQNHIMSLRMWIEKVVSASRGKLELQDGPMAVEITPKYGWDKATAVRFILEHIGDNNLLTLYAGDGPNDIAALKAVTSMGGICIGIGSDVSSFSHYRLDDQREFIVFLARLNAALADAVCNQARLSLTANL